MCLKYEKSLTEELLNSKEEVFTFYKIYRIDTADESIVSVYQKDIIYYYNIHRNLDKIITHTSDRLSKPLTELEESDGKVMKGIHVFLDKKNAEDETHGLYWLMAVPVTCKKEDLVAAGRWTDNPLSLQAVFMRVEIKEKDIIEALKGKMAICVYP